MLVICNECSESVSDKAPNCPKCGAPSSEFSSATIEQAKVEEQVTQIADSSDIVIEKARKKVDTGRFVEKLEKLKLQITLIGGVIFIALMIFALSGNSFSVGILEWGSRVASKILSGVVTPKTMVVISTLAGLWALGFVVWLAFLAATYVIAFAVNITVPDGLYSFILKGTIEEKSDGTLYDGWGSSLKVGSDGGLICHFHENSWFESGFSLAEFREVEESLNTGFLAKHILKGETIDVPGSTGYYYSYRWNSTVVTWAIILNFIAIGAIFS